jgi:23S rRNA-intervening sequence protein
MTVNSYRDLRVWQKAMDLVVASYQLTKPFPQSELYGLMSQIQRGRGFDPCKHRRRTRS